MSDIIPQDTPQKQCQTCKCFFSRTYDYFHKGTGCADGLRVHCKECANARNRELRKVNPPKRTPEAHKLCSSCGVVKLNTPENFAVHRATCRECICKQQHEYNQTHKKERTEWRKNHPESGKEARIRANRKYERQHRTEIRKRRRAIYQENIDRHKQYSVIYRQRHPEKFRQTQRASRMKFRERTNAKRRNYYARKRNAVGTHTAKDVQEQYRRQNGKCYWCGKELSEEQHRYHVDHIVPLSRGGSNAPDNLVVACRYCNDSRGNKLPHEWPSGGRLL